MALMNFDSSAFVADPDLIQALSRHAALIDCSEDRELFRQGDEATGLFIVLSGMACMSLDGNVGERVVNMRVAPGSLLGLPALVGNKAYSMSARAKTGAKISFVHREEFSQLMLNEPSVAMMVLRVLAAEVRSARMAMAGK